MISQSLVTRNIGHSMNKQIGHRSPQRRSDPPLDGLPKSRFLLAWIQPTPCGKLVSSPTFPGGRARLEPFLSKGFLAVPKFLNERMHKLLGSRANHTKSTERTHRILTKLGQVRKSLRNGPSEMIVAHAKLNCGAR